MPKEKKPEIYEIGNRHTCPFHIVFGYGGSKVNLHLCARRRITRFSSDDVCKECKVVKVIVIKEGEKSGA